MGIRVQSHWFYKWVLPAAASLAIGILLFGSLHWAAGRSDDVARARQQDLIHVVVSNMRDAVAHDQESATVWDDAVRKVAARDLEWLKLNLGDWMHTYFGHDAAIVLSPALTPIYEFIAADDVAISSEQLQSGYLPLVEALQRRLRDGDTEGVTERVLSIGESDFAFVGGRPAIISVKPIVSDSGKIEQKPGQEPIHVAVRFLDRGLPMQIGKEYQFAQMQFAINPPQDGLHSFIALRSMSGQVIGYFTWLSFSPGASVMSATLPAIALAMIAIFSAASLCGHAIWRRSARLAASRKELHHLALHDPLTGLANRARFGTELGARLASSPDEQKNCVLFVDLDRFKAVNDTFGHPTGDKLIAAVAERLKAILPNALIARVGGDEFTVLLEQADGASTSLACTAIVERLREPFKIDDAHLAIGASVGAALAVGPGDPLELTRQADIALYHAKAAGRGTYAIFGSHMDELLRRRRKLENDLRLALETKSQIGTYFQPVYSAEHNDIASLEALARWHHPEEGFIAPDVFIPIAEEMGAIADIGELVLGDACRLMKELPAVCVAVNASSLELCSDGYPLRVLSTLARWNIDPHRLEIEITESLALAEEERSDRNIAMLRRAGVRFAIDDFGTGYSSFSRLQHVKVDRIKIDKSFIEDMHGESSPFVEAMINMARAKGLKTTAEGVETYQQSVSLRSLGCDDLQGFLMSRPLSREAVIDLVKGEATIDLEAEPGSRDNLQAR
jgi:diguanylate cyclase (GGDEF)-like protein